MTDEQPGAAGPPAPDQPQPGEARATAPAVNPILAQMRQDAYRESRRLWAIEIGNPYPEDGGVQAARTNRDVVKDDEALL